MDRGLLTIPQDQIASISIGNAVLERKDKDGSLSSRASRTARNKTRPPPTGWSAPSPSPLSTRLPGKGAEALAKTNEPTVEVTVKRTAGEPIVLKYKKEAAGGAYLFTSSANSFLFRASEAAVDPVVKAKRETLIEAPKKAGAAQPAKAEEPKEVPGEAAQSVAQPVKPEEPKKPRLRPAEPVPAAESGKAEDERFQGAMQPPEEPKNAGDEGAQAVAQPVKPGEPGKALDEGARAVPAAEPEKAGDEHAPAAAKPDEPRNVTGEGSQTAQPEKPGRNAAAERRLSASPASGGISDLHRGHYPLPSPRWERGRLLKGRERTPSPMGRGLG